VTEKQYWWVSVGGAPYEPAVVCDEGIFTLGCPDPHEPEDIVLVKRTSAPLTPKEKQAHEAELVIKRQAEYDARQKLRAADNLAHGYRRFL